MSSVLPIEFDQLAPQVEGMPEPVVEAFRYELAQLLVEQGRLKNVPHRGDVVQFHGADGSEFELADPHLSEDQSQMVKNHLSWLLGL